MSVLPGFEYDIFISYRHNDNRSGWVTEFVNALQEELAATIKDPVSIYFDKNPRDGLLETHSVDKSLEGKLKCLIFIPIISQTYCDLKSFAWQHEFCAFNKLATEDQFGRDIRLSNGNVASRILPIKIHEVDPEDTALFEKELGGVLRAIEFIFAASGVNRPLTKTDNPDKNQNKTFYRDQVNKAANAIKELIQSMKLPAKASANVGKQSEVPAQTKKVSKKEIVIISGVLMLLVVLIYAASQYVSSPKEEEALDRSIAVLPFADLSANHDQQYFGDGMAEEIINVLAQMKELKVIARSSSFQFGGRGQDLKEVGKKLGVATVLEGSVRRSQGMMRVTAQLIRTSDGSHVWSKTFDSNSSDAIGVQEEIANAIALSMKATLSISVPRQEVWNEEAWKDYQMGRFYYDRGLAGDDQSAMDQFASSIRKDSTHSIVWSYLASSDWIDPLTALRMTDKALRLDSLNGDAWINMGLMAIQMDYSYPKALRYMQKALSCHESPRVLRGACTISTSAGRLDEAIRYGKRAIQLDPIQTRAYDFLARSYFSRKQYDSSLWFARKALDINPLDYKDNLVKALLMLKRWKEAEVEISKYSDEDDRLYWSCIVHFWQGNKARSDKELAALKKLWEKRGIYYGLGQLYSIRNEIGPAVNSLQTAFDHRDVGLAFYIKTDPWLDPLRTDLRFIAMIRKLDALE